ncbi:cylicin-2 protein [Spatholobus suberectus]|nr:cylicin-2 protein [Spatholobus suberectus]
MEERKNHPSLPSNYVTLAQLQERWLQQQNQINQPQPQPQEEKQPPPPKQNHHQRRDQHVVAPTNGTASGSRSSKQYVVKIRNDSGTHRRATEVASDDHRKSEAGIGDETADLDGKIGESKKKKTKKNWKAKRKTKTRREERAEKVQEKGASGEGSVKLKTKTEERGASGGGSVAARGNKEAEKTTIESELKEKKKNGGSVITEKVEPMVRVLPMNPGNGKQNGRLGKMNNGFRHSQSQRKYYGEARYGYGNDNGNGNGQHSKAGMQRNEKMVWIRKDEN